MTKNNKLLILIEDDANDVLLFQKAISKSGLNVKLIVLRDGEKAISYLSDENEDNKAENPDLILLDLKLPRKSGFEVLEWIKNDLDSSINSCGDPVFLKTSSGCK